MMEVTSVEVQKRGNEVLANLQQQQESTKYEELVRLFEQAFNVSHVAGDVIDKELCLDALEDVAASTEDYYQEVVQHLTALSQSAFVEVTNDSEQKTTSISVEQAFKEYAMFDWQQQRYEELADEYSHDELTSEVWAKINQQVEEELKELDKAAVLTDYIEEVQPHLEEMPAFLMDLCSFVNQFL